MKVLVIWYNIFHYLSGITNALNNIEGVEAQMFPLEYFNRQAGLAENLLTKSGISYFKNKYHKETRAKLLENVDNYKPDIVLFLNADYEFIVDEAVLKKLKNKGIKTVVWFVDSAKNSDMKTQYLENFDKIYSFEKNDIEYIKRKYNVKNVQYLPLGVCTDIYYPTEDKSFENDICFVGFSDEKRLKILETVAEYCITNNRKLIVYGQMWRTRPWLHRIRHENRFKKKYPNLYTFVVNKCIEPQEVAAVYNSSKICLNIIQKVHNGANPRTFEILGTKSFQLIDYSQGIADLFEDGKHLVMYRNDEELKTQLEYYLNNENKRDHIVQSGYELTINRYTMTKMVNIIVENIIQSEGKI